MALLDDAVDWCVKHNAFVTFDVSLFGEHAVDVSATTDDKSVHASGPTLVAAVAQARKMMAEP